MAKMGSKYPEMIPNFYQFGNLTPLDSLNLSLSLSVFKFYPRKTCTSLHFWHKIQNEGCFTYLFWSARFTISIQKNHIPHLARYTLK